MTDDQDGTTGGIARLRASRDLEPSGNWGAKRELASAVRELMDCLAATDAAEEELLSIAQQVRESAHRFAAWPRMAEPPGVAEGSLAGGMEAFMDRSPIKGLANPIAPPVDLVLDPDDRVVSATFSFGNAYEGAPGCAHGGFVAAVLDEALGMACIFSGGPAMTGEITIRYVSPTPINTPLRVEARYDRRDGRKIYTSGTIHAGDVLVARSHGVFISIDFSRFDALREEQRRREQGRDG
jgi:acyl-coenzyme A thioesterase PaaI-like protein